MADPAPQRPRASLPEFQPAATPSPLLGPLAIGVVGVGALYIARDIFVPLALAILLSFALGPVVLLLRRWHLGRVPSVIASVGLAFLVIFGIGALIGSQLARLAEDLPRYQSNITEKSTPCAARRPAAASSSAPPRW
jgi:predicted PurR-regulated permease PerM